MLNAAKNLKLNNTIFACASQYLPTVVTFNIYHALFVLLGLTIMFWPYPIVPLCAGLLVLAFNLYINFSTQNYGVESLYLLALVLVSLALLVYYKFRGRY
jgi:predicted neutral ceramidase superfamily lipid hydrolase